MTDPNTTQAVQDYLKAVYRLSSPGNPVGTNQLAENLEVAPASVTGMLKRLSKNGYIEYTPRQGAELTAKGLQVALEIIRHHRLLESFFVQRLGMDWAQAHREAEVLEHFISEEFESLIDQLMGHPDSDPQGSPIPTRDGEVRLPDWSSLDQVEVGSDYVVRRVRHENPALLEYLQRLGLVPGTRIRLLAVGPFDGPVSVKCRGEDLHLGKQVAYAIQVGPYSPDSPDPDGPDPDV